MTLLKNLLVWCLKYFYPSNSYTFDDVYYKSKKEMYIDELDSQYLNGTWYIAEKNIPSINLTRSLSDIFYLIQGKNNYSLAFQVENITNKQIIDCKVIFDNDNQEYTYIGKTYNNSSNYIYITLNSEITPLNIKSIQLSSEEIILNHIVYESIPLTTITLDDIIIIRRQEFESIRTNKNKSIVQKVGKIECKDTTSSTPLHSFELKNILPINYDSNQELIIEYNDGSFDHKTVTGKAKNTVSVSNLIGKIKPHTKVVITLNPYTSIDEVFYTGFKATVVFENVNRNDYVQSVSIEYWII